VERRVGGHLVDGQQEVVCDVVGAGGDTQRRSHVMAQPGEVLNARSSESRRRGLQRLDGDHQGPQVVGRVGEPGIGCPVAGCRELGMRAVPGLDDLVG
jgi:hypothetical protein